MVDPDSVGSERLVLRGRGPPNRPGLEHGIDRIETPLHPCSPMPGPRARANACTPRIVRPRYGSCDLTPTPAMSRHASRVVVRLRTSTPSREITSRGHHAYIGTTAPSPAKITA